jgi:hypothetical protein
MTPTSTPAREGVLQGNTQTTEHRHTPSPASDDEILGITSPTQKRSRSTSGPQPDANPQAIDPIGASANTSGTADAGAATGEPAELRAVFDANPELRRAWQDAQAYRETFATPEQARAATAQLADLDRLDALFFSRRPEDHAELARAIADLDPAAFGSLAQAIAAVAQAQRQNPSQAHAQAQNDARDVRASESSNAAGLTPAQAEFFHATNAAAVHSVLDAIESQVERLLPEGSSKSARNRVVGEIYRELDGTLRANRQLAQQVRDAFRSGALDAEHQRAIVSLITSRARQALPGVAKRVLNEWTSTVVAANQDRRARQRAAERRVDIAGAGGSGSDGRRSMAPRDIDYARMSDSDILNL